jgi:hypothetical protein
MTHGDFLADTSLTFGTDRRGGWANITVADKGRRGGGGGTADATAAGKGDAGS